MLILWLLSLLVVFFLPSARSVVHRLFLSGFKICLCLDTVWCLNCYTRPKKMVQLLVALHERHYSCNN
jgi:hypothetical protein